MRKPVKPTCCACGVEHVSAVSFSTQWPARLRCMLCWVAYYLRRD